MRHPSESKVAGSLSSSKMALHLKAAGIDEIAHLEVVDLVSPGSTHDPETDSGDGIDSDCLAGSFSSEFEIRIAEATVLEASNDAALCDSVSRNRFASFDSTVTDYDDLICPGAQAERSEEYREAVYGFNNGMAACPPMKASGVSSDAASSQAAAGAPNSNMASLQTTSGVPAAALIPQMRSSVATTGLLRWPCWPCGIGSPALVPATTSGSYGFTNRAVQGGTSPHATTAGIESQANVLDQAATRLLEAALKNRAAADHLRSQGFCALQGQDTFTVTPTVSDASLASSSTFTEAEMAVPDRTTVMLRNIPNDYTRDMLVELLDTQGFAYRYDYVYLPIDCKRKSALGYAFVNMLSHAEAKRCFTALHDFSDWHVTSTKVLDVVWGHPLQGLQAHVSHSRNSPLMHEDAPDEFRPLLFQGGVRVPFPPPTKKLQRPRAKGKDAYAKQRNALESCSAK